MLRQLRAHGQPPTRFPQSVVLCGVRNVLDCGDGDAVGGALNTKFNIKAKSLRLADFEKEDVKTLLAQHTEATGQAFTGAAIDAVWKQSQGQPCW